MARVRERRVFRFPQAMQRYDLHNENVFRNDLARELNELLSGDDRSEPIGAFADADTTPSVARKRVWQEANTGATSITAFVDGQVGQEIVILFTTANTTIVDGANLHLSGGANFVSTADDVLVLIFDGTSWYEVSRSVN